ncbi:MAG: hypothetical protein WCS01_16405 [bacterium]
MNAIVDAGQAREMIRCALATGEAVEVAASGLSMGAAFASGSRLVLKIVRWGCGDVVVFERDGRWIAHRVLWKCPLPNRSGVACVTKGDGVSGVDRPFVRTEELVGVVVGVIREKQVIELTHAHNRLKGLWRVARGLMAMCARKVFPGRAPRQMDQA